VQNVYSEPHSTILAQYSFIHSERLKHLNWKYVHCLPKHGTTQVALSTPLLYPMDAEKENVPTGANVKRCNKPNCNRAFPATDKSLTCPQCRATNAKAQAKRRAKVKETKERKRQRQEIPSESREPVPQSVLSGSSDSESSNAYTVSPK
jgi:hypothetical protein